jgi:hypothetical protein
MSRPVYILGAGFCRDFDDNAFPLVNDFLIKAQNMNIYRPREREHGALATFLHRYFGSETFHDIEKVLSFLSTPPLDDLHVNFDLDERVRLYDQLVSIIVRMLTAASAIVMNANNGGRATWQFYYKFIKHMVENQAIILTFNYDLLLETLLQATNEWQMYDGYGVEIPLVQQALPTPSFDNYKLNDYNPAILSKVFLLKLHGSINWGIPINQISPHFNTGDLIYRLTQGGPASIDFYQLPANNGVPLTMVFKPVIVPPVLDKSSWLRNRTFRNIWNMALHAVKTARELTFIGFSLPPTDFLAEFMLRQGSLDRDAKSITVVSPDASKLRPRFEQLFGPRVKYVDNGFHGWCIDTFYK